MYFKSPLKRISHNSKIYTIKKYAVGCLQKTHYSRINSYFWISVNGERFCNM